MAPAVSAVARALLRGHTVTARGYTASLTEEGFITLDESGQPVEGPAQEQAVPIHEDWPIGIVPGYHYELDPSPFGAAYALVQHAGPEHALAAVRALGVL